jgi:CBS domain containing-hemolysin-like protein
LSRAESIEQNMVRVETHKLSRYPYVDSDGNVIGIVHLKDLLLPQRDLRHDALEKAAKPPLVVPPELPASVLLQRFRLEGHHLAIVGSSAQRPAGFVTFDDLLSALMGGIRDEFRSSKTDWTRLEDGSLIARGSLPIFTLEQTLAIDIETHGARTVSGLILQKLEMLPRVGQRIEFDQFDVVVEKMDGARIAQIRVSPVVRTEQDDFKD